MPIELPGPVAAYLRATNEHDIDTRLEQFDEHARVSDEDREHVGLAAIRGWMEDAARKYDFTVDVQSAHDTDGRTIVAGLVSGTFAGSPALLRHAFTCPMRKIIALEIEA